MLFIRRLWLLPAFVITCLLFLFYHNAQYTPRQYQQAQPNRKIPPKVHWQKHDEHYPVSSLIPLPTGAFTIIPKIQHAFPPETAAEKKIREERRDAVKESFMHSWLGYKKYAWLKDEVSPKTGYFKVTFGGWAATLIDSLDSLWIMGEVDEFENAIKAMETIDFTTTETGTLNLFETTIRYLGGFLGAYDLSGEKYPVLLEKATALGEMLLSAFDTPNRMPMTRWDWMSSARDLKISAADSTLIAELGSLNVEFTRLSQLTKDPRYFDAVQRITDVLDEAQNHTKIPGLWPVVCNANSLNFEYNHFTFGGMADSAYEYLPKEHMMLGGHSAQYQRMYETAIDVAKKHLFFRPMIKDKEQILFSGNARLNVAKEVALEAQGQHLTCFTGGMVGIGAKIFKRPEDLAVARKLVDGCIWAYESMPTGLMPETFHMLPCEDVENCEWDQQQWYDGINHDQSNTDETAKMKPDDRAEHWIKVKKLAPGYTDIGDSRYILRPEAIESVFILYRITGDQTLLDHAWRMFKSIENATRTKIASSGIWDVRVDHAGAISHTDSMESFWLAETLKYFYLIFSDPSVVSLDDYVLNTEAHPLKRPS